MTYIATISGGKDSTAMCDLLLKNKYPVDYIVFNDTLDEFDEMYEYIEKLKTYFKDRYNKEITVLKPNRTYDEYIFKVRTRGERKGMLVGLNQASSPFCEWRRDSKILPFERWIKKLDLHAIDTKKVKRKARYRVYIGITIDEQHRTKREEPTNLYPLIDNFRMSEEDCKAYLIKQEMENPLYRHFNRTGCRKCFYQTELDFFKIWKHYPKVWEELKSYEKRVQAHPKAMRENKHWFMEYQNCEDLERKFKIADKQGSLFDLDSEPIKDCFCKI